MYKRIIFRLLTSVFCDHTHLVTPHAPSSDAPQTIDPSEDVFQQVDPQAVAKVIDAAREMYRLGKKITEIKLELDARQKEFLKFSTETLPNLMETAHMRSHDLADGYKLEMERVFRGSLPAESSIEKADDEEREVLEARRTAGFQWLKDHKARDIIKCEVKLSLPVGGGKFVRSINKVLRSVQFRGEKLDYSLTHKEYVHPGQLNKLLSEKLANGSDVPLDTFQIFHGNVAKIVAPKKAKS